MKKLARAVRFIFSLAILLAILGAAYFARKIIYGFLVSVSTSLSAGNWKAFVLASVPGLAGLFVVLCQKYADRKKDIEFKLRDEKVKTYTALLELVFDFFKAAKGKNADAQKGRPTEETENLHQLEMRFMDVSRMLLMWGLMIWFADTQTGGSCRSERKSPQSLMLWAAWGG